MSAPATAKDNLRAGAWLLADMGLNIWAISIVKALGAGYPPWQLVFLRALVGFCLILPWLARQRQVLWSIDRVPLHLFRVFLSAVALTGGFYAVAHLPLALYMTMNFTRPVVLVALSALILREAVSGSRWLAAGLGLVGAFIAASPGNVEWTPALLAALAAVLAGTGAIIVTRQLKGTPPVVMMLFYTGGLALITAWPAISDWQDVAAGHWPFLLAVGVFSQAAQFCFLRAHWLGDAGFLGPLGYSSLILSGVVGYVFFGEVPSLNTVIGAAIIVSATAFLTLRTARLRSHAASGS
ncbi:DMT family transporter [Nitratireductor aquimarinus]|uniref:DMT family transporter n=1 Tax=Nitratireductor aquimarinus TaxID=889300 RepID=A0ABU4AKA2_9HYPH|nr:DMT family transporter [Nitratireductor aquimarinus]MDV6226679.1 DMT family transporter [Nitratireductor aquimarinus]